MPATNLNAERPAETLERVLRAARGSGSVRACLMTTRDRDQAFAELRKAAESGDATLYHFTVAERRRYDQQRGAWESMGGNEDGPESFLDLLDGAADLKGAGLVALEDCVVFLRDEGGDIPGRMRLSQLLSIETQRQDGLVLVFVEPPESESHLPSILEDQFIRLDVPYPRLPDLEKLALGEIARLVSRSAPPLGPEAIREHAARLSPELVGLTRSAARDALRDALVAQPLDFEEAAKRLARRKSEQLRRELAMNVLGSDEEEEPVGLEYLVDYLDQIKDRARLTGKDRARGILLIGPPGTGKTMVARAIGRRLTLPVIEFRLSSLMNSLLGETERRFAQAFQTAEAMAPNVIFIDEIEKAFGDSSERDGGTMMRCTGALLSWLSDNPHPNFIVATSNSLRRMGEIGLTMTRSERFDAAFFVDVPALASRRRMLETWLTGTIDRPAEVAAQVAAMTEKFSGADLRSVVKQSIAHAAHRRVPLTADLLLAQAERKRERAVALYKEFRRLRRWGLRHCDPAGPTGG